MVRKIVVVVVIPAAVGTAAAVGASLLMPAGLAGVCSILELLEVFS